MPKIKISSKTEGKAGFEWPVFKSDKERIRFNTDRFAGVCVEEAFLGKKFKGTPAVVPHELKVGELFDVEVAAISKSGVVFKSVPTKQDVVCKTNLTKYRNCNPFNKIIKAKVIEVNKRNVVVDILQPIFDEWICGILSNPASQNVVTKDESGLIIAQPETIKVRDLQLLKKGFVGKVAVPTLSEFLGEPFIIEAFIPGSHIVLNIENDFSKWVGKDVDAFVLNYIPQSGPTQVSLVCSRKKLLTFRGNVNLIEMYGYFCNQDETWKNFTKTALKGKVTGILQSAKKCGVFVEIPSALVTGMIPMKPDEIVRYREGDAVDVCIVDFEDMSFVDNKTGFRYHNDPYVIEGDTLKSCILKPILKLA